MERVVVVEEGANQGCVGDTQMMRAELMISCPPRRKSQWNGSHVESSKVANKVGLGVWLVGLVWIPK